MRRGGSIQGAPRGQKSDHEKGIAPIAALFEDCLQHFERLRAATVESRQIKPLHSMVDGCFSKFRMWGSDTGAPDGSLDHALRKSSRLEQTTKDLAEDLLSTLRTSKTLVFSYCCKVDHSLDTSHTVYSRLFHADIFYCIFILQYCSIRKFPIAVFFSKTVF